MSVPLRSRLPLTLTSLAVAAGLTACAGGGGDTAAPSDSTPAASSSAAEETADPADAQQSLLDALLPADAFGADADVVTMSIEELSSASAGQLPPGASVEPEQCSQNVGATQVTPDDFDAIVAQTANSPAHVTVQVLAEGDAADAATSDVAQLLDRCPQVTITAQDGSTITVDFAALDVPSVGDSSSGVSMTIAIRGTDGTDLTVPSLLATATDGQRLLFLQRTGNDSTPLDEAAFGELFQQAFDAQQTD